MYRMKIKIPGFLLQFCSFALNTKAKAVNLRWPVFAASSFYQFHFVPKTDLAYEF